MKGWKKKKKVKEKKSKSRDDSSAQYRKKNRAAEALSCKPLCCHRREKNKARREPTG